MKKVIRNGHVAVLHSYDWGRGWYSWHGVEELLYLPELVERVEKPWSDTYELTTLPILEKILAKYELDTNILPDLKVTWVPIGTRFYIAEYDGHESVVTEGQMVWITA